MYISVGRMSHAAAAPSYSPPLRLHSSSRILALQTGPHTCLPFMWSTVLLFPSVDGSQSPMGLILVPGRYFQVCLKPQLLKVLGCSPSDPGACTGSSNWPAIPPVLWQCLSPQMVFQRPGIGCCFAFKNNNGPSRCHPVELFPHPMQMRTVPKCTRLWFLPQQHT